MYKIFIYIALFFIFAFIGWIIEVINSLIVDKKFVNRGFLIGPVVPIYGFGGIAITLFLSRYSDEPITLFCMATIICSILEYFTSYFMEKIFNTRWWDYSNKKFNLNGRICLRNLAAFGLMGLVMVKYAVPFIIDILEKIDPVLLKTIVSILLVIIMVDLCISTKIIYNVKTATLTIKDSTEEISAKVKEVLMKKGVFTRRVAHAFPDFRINTSFFKRVDKMK